MSREVADRKADIYLKKVVDTLHAVTVPHLTKAYVSYVSQDAKQLTIATRWNQKNYGLNQSDEFSIVYHYDKGGNNLQKISSPLEANIVLIETISPSTKQRAEIKKYFNETLKKDEYILEVWSSARRVKCVNLTSFNIHGQVHSDALFGSLIWSLDESKLVYVAEKWKTNVYGYFETVSDNSDNRSLVKGEKYNYEENWGEQLTDVTDTVLCIFTLSNDSLKIVEGIPDDVCPLQPEFGPDNTLMFTAFHKAPFKLGVMYCENRVCGLYLVNLVSGESAVELTKGFDMTANYHAHINGSETKVAFIQRQLTGFSNQCKSTISLMLYSFSDRKIKLVCDELTYRGNRFPLFVMGENIKYNFWLPDSIHVALPNSFEGRNYVCVVDTESGRLKSMIDCSDYLGMYNGIFLASYEKLNSETCTLMLIDYNNLLNPVIAKELCIVDYEMESGSLRDDHYLKSFYLMPKGAQAILNQPFPVFVSPHDGIHSIFTDDFNRNARLFCKLGYAVLLVNYRGSTGFSVDTMKSLPGYVCTQNVNHVHNTVRKFIRLKKNVIDRNNIFISAGSHGGFLGAHLIGQFPSYYRAASVGNPVIEVSAMAISTDIPDWTYFESGLDYAQDQILSSNVAVRMLSTSPVKYVGDIKAPVLLCIGGKDARVPTSQGKYFFRLLKANEKIVKMLLYPNDGHTLSNVETDGDSVINVCKWFYQHGSHSR